jgi:outer membrane protein OmpA-like peptidoglycan-associated protein
MAKGCRCRKHDEECECPEWIFTLADLVMCMMGLFVVLWVLKPGSTAASADAPQDQDWIRVAAAIREAFGYLPNPNSSDPVDAHMVMNNLKRFRGPGDGGKTLLEQKGAEGTDPEVTTIRLGPQAAVGGRLLFEPGDAQLTREATRALDQIVLQIRGHRNIVLVKGHTSLDDYGQSAGEQQRMNLSIQRAQAVAEYLTARRVEPEILRVQGCSTFEPVVQRAYTADAQALNRRVEVEVTTTLVTELQDRGAAPRR